MQFNYPELYIINGARFDAELEFVIYSDPNKNICFSEVVNPTILLSEKSFSIIY